MSRPSVQLDVVAAATDDEDVLHRLLHARAVPVGECHVDGGLERTDLALAVAAVGGDDELRAGIVDAGAQAVGGEPAEHDGVDRAEPRDGEHRRDRLGDHRHVDRDAIALADAESFEHVRQTLDLVGQLGVRHMAGVSRLALPQQGDAVAVSCLDVSVEAVVGDVEPPVGEPRRERRVGPVEHLGERGVPVQLPGLFSPEALAIGRGVLVQVCRRDGVRRELLRRCEPPTLIEEVIDLAAHARSFAGRTGRRVGTRAAKTGSIYPAPLSVTTSDSGERGDLHE